MNSGHRAFLFGPLLVLLAGCGNKQPLVGNWRRDVAPGTDGLELWFDQKDAVGGCNHQPDDDDDIDGKYTLTEGKLTINGKWKNSGKPVAMYGSLVGDRIDLSGADGRFTFHRAGSVSPHH